MSLYRFFRTSALLALAGKYRAKLYRIVVAIAIALVTAWLYGDIAVYLQQQHPDLLGPALLAKTVIVYGALIYAFWHIRPGAWTSEQNTQVQSSTTDHPQEPMPDSGPLDELLDKPKLKSRKDSILEQDQGT